ncbi:MAG: winged helix-turn-helix transcriptional regulator [Romboutsia sp.]|uniref:winged helix-turn-helix transcriptional regulator n=1 Tax=Romboutsia sp. TaxID=1965302 RepID=UPI003F38F515
MNFYYKDRPFSTTKDLALSVIGGRWKIAIVWCLLQEPTLRLNQIQKKLPTANQRMLIRQLRELEEDKIVYRTVYNVVPQRVDYTLTEVGYLLEPVVQSVCKWGDTFYKSLQ